MSPKQLRLIFVSHCFPLADAPMSKIGGMQRVGIDLLQHLEMRHDVDVRSVVLRSAGLSHYVRFLPFMAFGALKIRKVIENGEADAVLFSAMPSASMALMLGTVARRAGVPLIAIAHGHDVIADNFLYQKLVKRVFVALSGVLAVSRSTGDACCARGLEPSALFVTPNGIDRERFGTSFSVPSPARADRRKVLTQTLPDFADRLPPDALVLVSIGRQVRRKGQEWFIRSVMPHLARNVHLILGGHGPEAMRIAQAVKDTGLSERVHSLGLVPEDKLAGLYSGADIFVMPNIPIPGDMEGFGMVMLEASLCGLPSIAARIEGIQDVITEGVNGFTVASMDAAGFAEHINCFAKAPHLLDAMSISAHRHVLDCFSWQAVAGRIVATIRERIARQGA